MENFTKAFFFVIFYFPSLMIFSTAHNSIMEIVNIKEVERILQERKDNVTNEEKRFILQNELDEIPPPVEENELNENDYNHHQTNDKNHEDLRITVDQLFKKQNTSDPYKTTELLSDLRGYHSLKLLKSSRNALVVTKQEYLQRDWCKTEPLIQKIREEGCLTRTVINRFCYGQCNSFYIPKSPKKKHTKKRLMEETEDEDLNGVAFKNCASCRPKKFTWVSITLRCPSLTPQYKKRKIQRIKQCKCLDL